MRSTAIACTVLASIREELLGSIGLRLAVLQFRQPTLPQWRTSRLSSRLEVLCHAML
jgi:hypothetical protein